MKVRGGRRVGSLAKGLMWCFWRLLASRRAGPAEEERVDMEIMATTLICCGGVVVTRNGGMSMNDVGRRVVMTIMGGWK